MSREIAPGERILVAVDTPDVEVARSLVVRLRGRVGGFKLGLENFVALGPAFVREVVDGGAAVFLDLKLHDIPNTVAGAAAAASRLGVSFLTVHALGGAAMIRAARDASRAAATTSDPPVVLAVTVLTSHTDDDLRAAGIGTPCAAAVDRLAALARDAGADGVVCSPLEVAAVRGTFPEGVLVVPGVRPRGAATDDQKRVATPAEAIAAGADRLVIGRPITRAADPALAAARIAAEISVAP